MVRVFEIAKESGLDTTTVLAFLEDLGESGDAVSDLSQPVASRLKNALVGVRNGDRPGRANLPTTSQPRAAYRGAASPSRPNRNGPLRTNLKEEHHQAALAAIPELYAMLQSAVTTAPISPVVVFHNPDAPRPERYGVRTIEDADWAHTTRINVRQLTAPLRELDRWYHERDRQPPGEYLAIDLNSGTAWQGRSLESLRKKADGPRVDALSLAPIPQRGEGLPPRLAPRAQLFNARTAARLRAALSSPGDAPEEIFLLDEDLLRLAIDSLDGTELLDPPPVHTNATWVFARPVIMQRPDGTDRYVRGIWFRQGQVMWRLRTFAAGTGLNIKQVGDQLTGRIPFVPVWDETRPEQQVLAAVWALMSQGGITETQGPAPQRTEADHRRGADDVYVVRVKAGTDHARAYGDHDPESPLRPAWSVRGHWRRQPYPSLGTDEDGNVITRLIWIASYTKGDPATLPPGNKVIAVRA